MIRFKLRIENSDLHLFPGLPLYTWPEFYEIKNQK